MLELLAPMERICVDSTEVWIDREVGTKLRRATENVSVLVVGEPGSGKSGALYDLVRRLLGEGRDLLFLVVDRLDLRSLGQLRDELRLEHELTDVLSNWPGTKRGHSLRPELPARVVEASIDRVAIARALVECGYLLFRRRRISPPLIRRRVEKIS